MTIKEMLKKVEIYNEVADNFGTEKAELWVNIGYYGSVSVKDYRSFKDYLNRTYIKTVAGAILCYSEYEFDKEYIFEVPGFYGDTFTEKVEFYLAYKR